MEVERRGWEEEEVSDRIRGEMRGVWTWRSDRRGERGEGKLT